MKQERKVYCFDIDNTICSTDVGDYLHSKPILERIEIVRRLAKDNVIIFWTSRGVGTGYDWRETTERQFKEWGVPYDYIIFNKPYFDVFIDDHAINDIEFFG